MCVLGLPLPEIRAVSFTVSYVLELGFIAVSNLIFFSLVFFFFGQFSISPFLIH